MKTFSVLCYFLKASAILALAYVAAHTDFFTMQR